MTRHMDVANSAVVKAAIPALRIGPAISVTAKCVPWAPLAAPWQITIPPPATERSAGFGCDGAHQQAPYCGG
jgi:hypothetical protein